MGGIPVCLLSFDHLMSIKLMKLISVKIILMMLSILLFDSMVIMMMMMMMMMMIMMIATLICFYKCPDNPFSNHQTLF